MVSRVGFRVLCWEFWLSGCLFLIFGQKNNTDTQKQDWKNTYIFLVTNRLYLYLSSMPVHLDLITYITMLVIVNKIH